MRFFSSENRKNIARICSGTMLGQAITVLTLPIIARIYGAETIGVFTLFNSIALIVKSFSDIGLTNAIMIEEENEINRMYKVITTIAAGISIIASLIITVYNYVFIHIKDINLIFMFLFLLIMIFMTQQIQICYTWLNRMGKYDVLMKNPIINNSVYGIAVILFGIMGARTYGYFAGWIIGQVITLMHMKKELPKGMFTFKMEDFKNCIKRNRNFVLYQLPTNVIADFKNQIPVLLIKTLWGNEMLGYYSVTVRFLQIPTTLLANAIGRVFFQTASEMKRRGKAIGETVFNNINRGMKLGIIPIALIMGAGEIFIRILFGNEFEMAGLFIKILSLQYFFMFLMNTVQGLSIVLNKQNYAMIACAFQIAGYIAGALIGKNVYENIFVSLGLMTAFFIAVNIAYFSALFRVMNMPTKKYIANALISSVSIVGLSILFNALANIAKEQM